ncbi:hypothetical protein [Geoalkalibacter halelectricus]|uniref:hypothetical protein n=1 Tax=Geoalkalibacter halelectricus TaxID=2847045 RepID=UPI003D21FFDE
MTIKEYRDASGTRIALKALRFLVSQGAIHEPLHDADKDFLMRLEKIWGHADLLRAQMAHMGSVRRRNLLETADLEDRWQRHLQTYFYNMGLRGKKVATEKVVHEVAERYPSLKRLLGENADFVMREAKRLRRRASALRSAAAKKERT